MGVEEEEKLASEVGGGNSDMMKIWYWYGER